MEPLYLVKPILEGVGEVCRSLGDIHVVYERCLILASKHKLCDEAEIIIVDASW